MLKQALLVAISSPAAPWMLPVNLLLPANLYFLTPGFRVKAISAGCFVVASERDERVYYIVRSDTGCTCHDSSERQMICKHQWCAFISAAITIWRMADATSRAEVESLLSLHALPMPIGIKQNNPA